MTAKLLLVQIWGKMAHLPQPTISFVLLLSVMTTLHYHRLYQISSLEANLSLEDMKQLCVERSHRYTHYPRPQN